jgi:hypothetical protein
VIASLKRYKGRKSLAKQLRFHSPAEMRELEGQVRRVLDEVRASPQKFHTARDTARSPISQATARHLLMASAPPGGEENSF